MNCEPFCGQRDIAKYCHYDTGGLWIQMKIANREDSPTTKALTVNRNRAHLISENGLYAR